MTDHLKKLKWQFVGPICLLIYLTGCNPNSDNGIAFTKTKNATLSSATASHSVKSYFMSYNPKTDGVIVITLADNSQYTASKLDASQLSALLNLLANKDLAYDSGNDVFRLKGGSQ
ncbi:hypothetical protein [Mucilaginibacter sp.]|uniref:hypothetical protein n=1 Tax=Mucilaginibacter sp. TaxID=1882438 RepID=UPI0025F27F04|nr:hypothetical protein [Mucilaginibacter sp.]